MNIGAHSVRNMTVLRLSGDFTYLSRTAFKDAAEAAKVGGCQLLLLDLAAVTFIDSAALGVLMLLAQTWKLEQRRVMLIRPKPHVRELLHTQNVLSLLPVYESEGAAMAALFAKTGAA